MAADMTTVVYPPEEIQKLVKQARAQGYDESRVFVFERYLQQGKRSRALDILVKNPVCGARKPDGLLCLAAPLHNGRCKWHGGGDPNPGPKTPEGRARIAEAQRRRWAAWRESRN